MKTPFSFAMLVLSLLVLQTTVAPSLILVLAKVPGLAFLAGHTVDFMLICLIYLIVHRGLLGAILWGAFFGILAGAFGMAWRGATALSFFSLVLLGFFIKRQVLLHSRVAVLLLVAGFTLLEGFFHLGAGHLFSRIPSPLSSQWGTLITQAILNALMAVPLHTFFASFDEWVGGRSDRERRSLLVET